MTDQWTDLRQGADDGRTTGAASAFSIAPPPVDPSPSSSRRGDLISNFRAGLKVMFFRRVAPEDFRDAAENIALLVILDLAVVLLFDFLLVGFNGHFRFSELPTCCFLSR